MRLVRVQLSARKTVIYHPSFTDVLHRVRCIFGRHQYEVVRAYPSVGAKEEMCLHCLKERYSLDAKQAAMYQAPNAI